MPERRLRVLALALRASACSSGVAPWQRGYLAEPAMQFDAQPAAAQLQRQYYYSREAARGGHSFGATGCGCN